MPQEKTLQMDDMNPNEISQYMYDTKTTEPGGKYVVGGVVVNSNGVPFENQTQTQTQTETTPDNTKKSKTISDNMDVSTLSKEDLMQLPEVATINGADKMSQVDLVRAVNEARATK